MAMGSGEEAFGGTRQAEAVLRDRYAALWEDVQRELEKYRGEQYPDLVQQGADPDDRAQADLLVDVNLAEIDRDVDELRAIHHALERIKSGTYGVCQRCGERIDPERLKAVPHAALCIDCQAHVEANRAETPSL